MQSLPAEACGRGISCAIACIPEQGKHAPRPQNKSPLAQLSSMTESLPRSCDNELLGHRHTVVFSPVLTNAATGDAIDIEVHKCDRLLMERNATGCAGVETAPGGTNGDQVALSEHDVDDDLALFKRGAHRAGLGQLGKWPALGHGCHSEDAMGHRDRITRSVF